MSGLRAAIRHLTILPLPWSERDARARPADALKWFPLVGLSIGAAVAAVLLLPLPAFPRAAIALAVWTVLTGGLHEDGWMDCADASLAVVSRERRLEILKDPHVGAHAVTALILLLLLRMSALTAVPAMAPVIAALAGRWAMVLTLAGHKPARPDGLGAAFAAGAKRAPASVLALLCLVALFPWSGVRGVVAAAAGCAAAAVLAAWLAHRFGGLTGDAHGAAGLAAETAALLAFLNPSGPA